LADPGEERLRLYKNIQKLYNERSTAAHTAKELDHEPLVLSYVHLRNALFKMIDSEKIPSTEELEVLLFNPQKCH
jgi:hypothetical protein